MTRPDHCPTCDSPDPKQHPAVQFEGEVQICKDPWHFPTPEEMAKTRLSLHPDDARSEWARTPAPRPVFIGSAPPGRWHFVPIAADKGAPPFATPRVPCGAVLDGENLEIEPDDGSMSNDTHPPRDKRCRHCHQYRFSMLSFEAETKRDLDRARRQAFTTTLLADNGDIRVVHRTAHEDEDGNPCAAALIFERHEKDALGHERWSEWFCLFDGAQVDPKPPSWRQMYSLIMMLVESARLDVPSWWSPGGIPRPAPGAKRTVPTRNQAWQAFLDARMDLVHATVDAGETASAILELINFHDTDHVRHVEEMTRHLYTKED